MKRVTNNMIIAATICTMLFISGCVGLSQPNNIFVGNWKFNGGEFLFRDDGTGMIYGSLMGSQFEFPLTYEYDEQTIAITSIDIMSDKLRTDTYNYELSKNTLKLSKSNGKETYLIKSTN